ncbi:MAG: glucokinase [Rhodanobacteraceae bacterium]|nr:MAG: glucokinase [Rhodanobacteraceae bacterium]
MANYCEAVLDPSERQARSRSQPFLAADVGGTHARVALLRADARAGSGFEVLAYRSFLCASFSGLAELLKVFVDLEATAPVRCCVIACAGQVIGDAVVGDNLAWPVRLSQLRKACAFDDVAALNDFEALGYALDGVKASGGLLLCGPDVWGDGPALVVGPGTGLGAAVRLAGKAGGTRVLATEAGQMDFAPASALERKVLEMLASDAGHVPCERLLSGPGLLTLYVTLCALRGKVPMLASPEVVTAVARAGEDAVAVETVDLFCAVLGGFVGNLAMAFMARGGVYIAGGVLPQIKGLLQGSRFAERFLGKGRMREFLLRVPVRLIEHGRHGVVGAAHWYLDQTRRRVRPGAFEEKTVVA